MDYLDSEGLTYYDSKIKGYMDDVVETSVLPMIPKKGTVSLGNTGYVTGGQVYNAIGSGGGGSAEYPFPYVKIKNCRKFCINSDYLNGASIYDYHTSNTSINPLTIEVHNTYSRLAFGSKISSDSGVAAFTDAYAFDAIFFIPPQASLTTPDNSNYPSSALYTSEGEMEIHNYKAIKKEWMNSIIPPVVKIDGNMQYIGSKALFRTNLTLYISAIEPPIIQTDSFYTFKEIHVPSSSLEAYKTANNWSAYADYMIGDL